MHVLVRQQARKFHALRLIHQAALRRSIVARFVMLQSKMRHVIAQRQQKMIIAVMPRPEQRPRFSNQIVQMQLACPASSPAPPRCPPRCRSRAKEFAPASAESPGSISRRSPANPPASSAAPCANSIVSPSCLVIGSAVPNFHPAGSFRLAAKGMSFAGVPFGYSSTWFQLNTSSDAVAEAARRKILPEGAESRKSRSASSVVTPAGISR